LPGPGRNGARQIRPETERYKQLRNYKHWTDQEMHWIIEQRRFAVLEPRVSDDLQSPAGNEQAAGKEPDDRRTGMARDQGRDQ
jgi:hypothetical protein